MKLNARTVPEFLRQPDRQCAGVLIYGPDGGQVRERAKQVLAAVLGSGADPLAVSEIAPERLKDDPAALADALCAMSLLGGRTAVLLRDAGDRQAKAVQAALEVPGRGNYLVVCAEELSARSALRLLFESRSELAALPCYRDEAADIAGLVRRKLEQAGVRAAREAVEYLGQHLGNDRMVTHSELDKIILFLGEEKTLTLEHVEQLVGPNREVALDEIALAVAGADLRGLDERLQQVAREGMQPVALLRGVQRHFSRLYAVREAMQQGKSLEAALAGLRPSVFFRHQQAFARQAQGWDIPLLTHAFRELAQAELACKTTGANPQLMSARALMRLARMGARFLRAA